MLQSRARDDAMSANPSRLIDPGSDGAEPWQSVFVRQRDPAVHFVDIGTGVEPITVHELALEACRQERSDGCFAASRNTHDDHGDRRCWRLAGMC
jgi:hypothetical protein